jgi:hypothetical protein
VVPSPAAGVDPRAVRHQSAQGRPLGVLAAARDPADHPTMGSLWCLRKVLTFLIVFFAL